MLGPASHHIGILRRLVGYLLAALPLCAGKGLVLRTNIESLLTEVFILLGARFSRVVCHDGLMLWPRTMYDADFVMARRGYSALFDSTLMCSINCVGAVGRDNLLARFHASPYALLPTTFVPLS